VNAPELAERVGARFHDVVVARNEVTLTLAPDELLGSEDPIVVQFLRSSGVHPDALELRA